MNPSRRLFIRDGVATVALGVSAPAFVTAIARAQTSTKRHLVAIYLGGGNDALNTLVPYQDRAYYDRRPTIAIPPGEVLQVGTDSARNALGLHPRLEGLVNIFNQGHLAIVQRTGYVDSSRSHFEATAIWGTGKPDTATGSGWLGRYLDRLPRPFDALTAWNTASETPRALAADLTGVPSIPNVHTYTYASPNSGAAATHERAALEAMVANAARDRPHLAFVNGTSRGALDTLDRLTRARAYVPTVGYPGGGLANSLQTVAGAIVSDVGARVFWVQTGGYDTHAQQGSTFGNYGTLMATLGDGLAAFYQDLRNQGALADTTVIVFSEFGRRISENGSRGTDHGAAGLMMVLGGSVRGGLYGTAASLAPGHPTLENDSGDVRHEFDFRSVYARVLDQWLGVDSTAILQGNFRAGAPAIF